MPNLAHCPFTGARDACYLVRVLCEAHYETGSIKEIQSGVRKGSCKMVLDLESSTGDELRQGNAGLIPRMETSCRLEENDVSAQLCSCRLPRRAIEPNCSTGERRKYEQQRLRWQTTKSLHKATPICPLKTITIGAQTPKCIVHLTCFILPGYVPFLLIALRRSGSGNEPSTHWSFGGKF